MLLLDSHTMNRFNNNSNNKIEIKIESVLVITARSLTYLLCHIVSKQFYIAVCSVTMPETLLPFLFLCLFLHLRRRGEDKIFIYRYFKALVRLERKMIIMVMGKHLTKTNCSKFKMSLHDYAFAGAIHLTAIITNYDQYADSSDLSRIGRKLP